MNDRDGSATERVGVGMMAALSDTDVIEPFGRYRFRGLDPKSVERWATNYENENAGLRAQIVALEARATKADEFAEEALIEAATLRETVARTDAEREEFAARQRIFRDEAAQIIHDAWTEANAIRGQAQELADQTHAQREAATTEHAQQIEQMRAEAAAEIEVTVEQVRRTLAAGLETQQARVATLERQCVRLVAEIESCTTSVLNGIAPLKESAARADYGQPPGTPEYDAPGAVHEAAEALSLLMATMRQSLNASSDERAMASNGSHPSESEDAVIVP
jgi:signal transduction histidine kinase